MNESESDICISVTIKVTLGLSSERLESQLRCSMTLLLQGDNEVTNALLLGKPLRAGNKVLSTE